LERKKTDKKGETETSSENMSRAKKKRLVKMEVEEGAGDLSCGGHQSRRKRKERIGGKTGSYGTTRAARKKGKPKEGGAIRKVLDRLRGGSMRGRGREGEKGERVL